MPVPSSTIRTCAMVVLAGLLAAGCSTVKEVGKVTEMVQPYKIDRVQGNVVTREQATALKPGMPRNVVRDILGTPLLASVFHADRWDYVFTFNRQGAPLQSRQVTVYFKGDVLERVQADDLPSETEFVATLKSDKPLDKLPPLEASPEALQKYAPKDKPASTPVTPPVPASAASYPPLEPTAR